MLPEFDPSTCRNVQDFISNLTKLNKNLKSNIEIPIKQINEFINNNESFFPQVMTHGNGRYQMEMLSARLSLYPNTDGLRSKINSVAKATWAHIPDDVKKMVLPKVAAKPQDLIHKEGGQMRLVSREWNRMTQEGQANFINQNTMPLSSMGFHSHQGVVHFMDQMKTVKPPITCLNLENYEQFKEKALSEEILELLSVCPNAHTFTFGASELDNLQEHPILTNPEIISAQGSKTKVFHFTTQRFSFMNLRDLSALGNLYPNAAIHLDPHGYFTTNQDSIIELLDKAEEGKYVICPKKGSPGVFDVSFKVAGKLYQIPIGPPNDLEDLASGHIHSEVNSRMWDVHQERPVASLPDIPLNDILNMLRRNGHEAQTLNLRGLENNLPHVRNSPGFTYLFDGREWDDTIIGMLKCCPNLKTLSADVYFLHTCPRYKEILQNCNQLHTLKIQGETNNWRMGHFAILADIAKIFPELTIELPNNGHFCANKEKALELLQDTSQKDCYVMWPSNSVRGAMGFLFKIDGKPIAKPLLLKENDIPSGQNHDLLQYILSLPKKMRRG